MWEKCLILCLVLGMLLAAPAMAQNEDPVFEAGREALALLSYGEYGRAIGVLGLTDVTPDALAARVEADFRMLFRGTVQTDVAVKYCTREGEWFLALPVAEPSDPNTETMVFSLTEDGRFTGIRCSTWSDVLIQVDECRSHVWNEEYFTSAPVLETDR